MKSKKVKWAALSILIPGFFLALFYQFQESDGPSREISSLKTFTASPPTELGESWSESDVMNSVNILKIIQDQLDKDTAGAPIMYRDAHPKHHGCVKANLEINKETLPAVYKYGVFSEATPKSYEAWVRFSNGNPNQKKSDKDGDVRGMAIKLLNVKGTANGSFDFLMMNSKNFFLNNSVDYVKFMKSPVLYIATHFGTASVILKAFGVKAANPLQIDYFSATPYKLGNHAVKYSMRSCTPEAQREEVPKTDDPNFLKEKLANSLAKSSACFNMYVQISTDPKLMPVESPMIEWDESISPYIKVATLTIMKQTGSNTTEQMNFCENLSFDPWNSLPDQRPLGAINRSRLLIYSAISSKRHAYNHIPKIEPKTLNACDERTQELCK